MGDALSVLISEVGVQKPAVHQNGFYALGCAQGNFGGDLQQGVVQGFDAVLIGYQ